MSTALGARSLAAQRNHDSATERALIEQCRRRDYDAFGKIIDLYQARVLGFVRRMLRNEEDSLDVTQEVFIKAYQAIGTFDGRSSLRSWLFRIAYNLCVDKARRKARSLATISIAGSEENEEPLEFSDGRWDPSQAVLDDELKLVIEQAVCSMSDKLRTVLLLHDREDMGYEEIAATINVPVGTVKSRLFLARNHLQNVVREYMYGEVGR
ncbi:sigma-70 family RNA polymerase sigma factor [Kamptonema cortianum]|nr:sigma-70 family RNA polymerase sigma factor [Geitlerinema splendidum]MDK3158397.1 sigma-70 family RNA polymerase sigma factor [Kamptonema cortianum]